MSHPLHLPKAEPFPLSLIRLLGGPFKEIQDVHERYLVSVVADRLLAPFRLQAGLPAKAERYGGWESRDISGHSLGHYLSALSLHFAATGKRELHERIGYIVDELEACQKADGEGYVLPVRKAAFEELRAGKIDVSPFSLNGVWVPFYTLHKLLAGLRDAYRLAGKGEALPVARGLADWLAGVLVNASEVQIQEILRAEHGGMNEVLADLTADTGEERYLEMASRYFHHRLVLDPMLRGEDRLDGLHGNTQIPKVVGLAREYELTCEPSYRRAAEAFWETVVRRRSYAVGGHGESEHFFPLEQFPLRLTPNTCETCNTYNMLKLTGHLFSWEPKAEQMDFVERAMVNHLAANIGRQPGEFGYFLGLGSVGVKVFSTPFDSWWCCVGTGMENPSRYGEHVYYQSGATLWVNLYLASTLEWIEKGVRLRQETAFPDGDRVTFTISSAEPVTFALRLRHPHWCAKPEIRINGEPFATDSAPSSYFSIERRWSDGDRVEMTLPMTLRLEALPQSEGKTVAVLYGPSVLAGIVPDVPGILNPSMQRFGEHLSARGKTDAFPPLFVAADSEEILSNLIPLSDDFATFRSLGLVIPNELTFIPLRRVYEEQYAVYFPIFTATEWKSREGDIRAEREARLRLEAATLDSVTPGYQQPEVEHWLLSEKSEIEDFSGRKCRLARDGGWFSYEMAVDARDPVVLIATYWGGVWHKRVFDLFVDGEGIDTQSLLTNKPGDFYDEVHVIPPELTRGKTRVTVRIQSREGDIAGGVYGLRILRASAAPSKGFDATAIVFKDH